MRLALAISALLPLGLACGAEGPSLLDFELRSLERPEVHSLQQYQGKPIVMVFFKPDCNWCLKQIRSIRELRERCHGELTAIAIGVSGTRPELRKELRRLRPGFPAYQASPELIESLGGVVATPMSLLGDSDGAFVNWARGYLAEEALGSFVQPVIDEACPTTN